MSWISPRVIRGNRGDIASRYCILNEFLEQGADIGAVFAERPEHVPPALRGKILPYGPIYNIWPRLKGLSALRRARFVFWTGGLDLQDDSSLLKLIHLWLCFASYRLLGLRILLVMQGAGPLTSKAGRGLTRGVLALVDAALVRDPGSLDLLARLTDPRKLTLVHDGVFLSGLQRKEHANTPARRTRPRIGINVRMWFHFANSIVPYQFAREAYLARAQGKMTQLIDALAAVVRHLRTRHDAEVILLSMYEPGFDPWEDDLPQLEALKAHFADDQDVRVFTDDASITDFADMMGDLDLMIGARLHSTLIALRMGVPALHIGYTNKGPDIYRALGLADWVVDIEAFMQAPEILCGMADSVLAVSDPAARFASAVDDAILHNRRALSEAIARMEA